MIEMIEMAIDFGASVDDILKILDIEPEELHEEN